MSLCYTVNSYNKIKGAGIFQLSQRFIFVEMDLNILM